MTDLQQQTYSARLVEACANNNIQKVEELLGMADTAYADFEALRIALRNKNAGIVQMILKATDSTHSQKVVGVFLAAPFYTADITKLFAQYVRHTPETPDTKEQILILMGTKLVKNGDHLSVQHLITQCNPKTNNSRLLQLASQQDNTQVFDLLYGVSDHQQATDAMVRYLNKNGKNAHPSVRMGLEKIKERVRQDKFHTHLTAIVDDCGSPYKRKM